MLKHGRLSKVGMDVFWDPVSHFSAALKGISTGRS